MSIADLKRAYAEEAKLSASGRSRESPTPDAAEAQEEEAPPKNELQREMQRRRANKKRLAAQRLGLAGWYWLIHCAPTNTIWEMKTNPMVACPVYSNPLFRF